MMHRHMNVKYFQTYLSHLTDDTVVAPSNIPYLSTNAISVQDFARNTAPYVKTATEVFFRNYEACQIVASPEIRCRL
jgi:hypothetical protein